MARPATAATTITQRLTATGREPHEKRERLRDIIRGEPDLRNAIIFCNRKREVAVLHRSLQRHGFNAAALHGDMDQRARMAALDSFRIGDVKLLVASDVAARGLDIPAVSHIFNYDVPHHAEDYVHRIGRTGRAGRAGQAVTLVAPGDEKALAAIEKLIGQTIPWEGPPPREAGPRESRSTRAERGGRGERRPRRGERTRRPDRPRDERPRHPERPRHEDERRPLPAMAPDMAAGRSARDAKPAKGQRSGRPEGPVVGLGDHVPAFLKRPVFPKEK